MPESLESPEARRILLVEDDDELAGTIARHLRARGHSVTVAGSAESAIAVLAAGSRPSLVLLDINLPGESGWSFLRSDLFRQAGSPPVVIVSATTVPSSRLHEFGVAGYLPKPFALATLMEVVQRIGLPGAAADASTGGSLDAF